MIDILQKDLLAKINKKKIVSIGDSHSCFFENLNYIKINHIGPVTAYNLMKENSTTRGREIFYDFLKTENSNDTALLLSFGEIDLRVHVVKASLRDFISIKDSAINTAKRYIMFIDEILNLGWTILVQGPSASGEERALNLDYPYSGSIVERNQATIIFNNELENYCKQNSILFASLCDLSIDQNTFVTKSEYLFDGCHLYKDPYLQSIMISRYINFNN